MSRSVRLLAGTVLFLAAVSTLHLRYARRGPDGRAGAEGGPRGEELVVGHLPVT